ncbi:MAG: 16S rRNA (adenine(1518)-N(6)/adenine(1519)-N(6))-dimethyltransferase RsmA [Bacteroidetes bacterium]|nr:16S rRNA (adenine(1518)-N(6)/adenine(1519)-N(6))-dimethyltransferase RsmA [Bacteroidota bacterium]MDA1120650.1 16S rRNA (adenine(1518)-N(6)/adenine(1519)-N(6))-dimethyltransferase RsmA [Bacteroidota bacterium]
MGTSFDYIWSMRHVKPKKHLGQHFLIDPDVTMQIVNALHLSNHKNILEIGPGTGVLTEHLMRLDANFKAIEIDKESITHLYLKYPEMGKNLIQDDFLKCDIESLFHQKFSIIGNFPYNISSQIFFKILENIDKIDQVVCMLQREVAQRIASPPGKKSYGILSVLLQVYYDIENLFDVPPDVFNPPPKVWSSVIRLKRNDVKKLNCDEKLFKTLVKAGFHKRRKTLRNALKSLNLPAEIMALELLDKRAEQLSIGDFEHLAQLVELK